MPAQRLLEQFGTDLMLLQSAPSTEEAHQYGRPKVDALLQFLPYTKRYWVTVYVKLEEIGRASQQFLAWRSDVEAMNLAALEIPMLPDYHAPERPTRFGERFTPPPEIIRHYLSNVEKRRRPTMNDVARALETWRRQRRFDAFRQMFSTLRTHPVNGVTMPIMLSALTESYLIRDYLHERREFREWVREHASESADIGPERSESIFTTLA